MAFDSKSVIIEDKLDGLASGRFDSFVAHVYCFDGECDFAFNGMYYHQSRQFDDYHHACFDSQP